MCSIAVSDVVPPGVNMPGKTLQVLVAKFRCLVAYLTQKGGVFPSCLAPLLTVLWSTEGYSLLHVAILLEVASSAVV